MSRLPMSPLDLKAQLPSDTQRQEDQKIIAEQHRRIIELEEGVRGLARLLRSAWDKPVESHHGRYDALAETNREARERIKRLLDIRRGTGKKK